MISFYLFFKWGHSKTQAAPCPSEPLFQAYHLNHWRYGRKTGHLIKLGGGCFCFSKHQGDWIGLFVKRVLILHLKWQKGTGKVQLAFIVLFCCFSADSDRLGSGGWYKFWYKLCPCGRQRQTAGYSRVTYYILTGLAPYRPTMIPCSPLSPNYCWTGGDSDVANDAEWGVELIHFGGREGEQ